jgi:prostaglandin-E synthase 1
MGSLFLDAFSSVIIELPGFKLLGMCASLLLLKIYALGMYTGALRARAGVAMNAEDADASVRLTEADSEPADVARANRAHRNDVENVPGFLSLALIAVLAGVQPLALRTCITIFTAARFAHTFFYLRSMQPWRSVSHGIASLAMLVLGALLVRRMLG